ncbi:hypothetical protein [Teichococcus aestuarii]|uniref:PilZ domain-containing protein n=1 Tax=Teichococcus aestuarii TaxID=568898 RepID=A0A2U1V830_9PROT|nr:hypothetical protein [Pseudoroseomonas aestuarii]PWC30060.1 hypothetical protein CR165_04135 [Pseudoroseomonas aestuarii]
MGMTRRRIISAAGWLQAGLPAAWFRAAAAQPLAAPAAKPLAAPATLARLAEAEAALFLEHGATLGALSLTEPLSAESRAMLRQRRREADVALGALLDAVRSDPGLPEGPALAAALAAVADSQMVIVLLRAGMDRPAPDRPAPSAIAWAEARARQEAAMAALRGLFWARLSLPAPPALPPPGPEAAPAGPQAAAPPAAPRTATAGPAPGGRQPGWPWLAWPWLAPAGGLALLLLLALRAAGRERTDQGRAARRVAVDWPAEFVPAPGLQPVAARIVSLSLGGAALRPERAGWGGRLRLALLRLLRLLPPGAGRGRMRLRNARLGEIEVQLVQQEGGLLRLRFLALDAAQAAMIGGLVATSAAPPADPAADGSGRREDSPASAAPSAATAAPQPPPAEWETWRGG